jgi:smad nuclear-interacting protein 1
MSNRRHGDYSGSRGRERERLDSRRLERGRSRDFDRRRSRSRSDSRRRHRVSHDPPRRPTVHDEQYTSRTFSRGGVFDNLKCETLTTYDRDVKIEKELPNFEVSGLLAEDQNQISGVPLIFAVSVDAAEPDSSSSDWRLFEFVGEDSKRTINLKGCSCFLFGSDARLSSNESEDVCFVYVEDTSVSKQHAVIQFRRRSDAVKPYLMDLESSNKTRLNGDPIEPGRYVELRHEDVILFGRSESEYVLLNAVLSS